MRYLIKTNIPFILILLIVAMFGCQMQKQEQSNGILTDSNMKNFSAVSADNTLEYTVKTPTVTISSTDKASTDPYTKQQKQLMLQEDYAGALQLMPQVKEEFLARAKGDKKEEAGKLFFIRQTYCYLSMMLDRDEDAYIKIKEMTLESSEIPMYFIYADNIAILSRLNKTDEIIVEANKILCVPDLPAYFEHTALNILSAAYLINNDNDNALKTISHWKKRLLDTSPHFDESLKRGFVESMFKVEHFIEHLQDEYVAKFYIEKPKPPKIDPLDDEKIILGYHAGGLGIVSRKDGSYLEENESLMKIIKEKTVSFMKSSRTRDKIKFYFPFTSPK